MDDGIHFGWARRLGRLPAIGCGVAATAGGLALVGWQFDIESLKNLIPGAVAMNPITALTFLAAAASLWLLTRFQAGSPARGIGYALAACVLLSGLAKLVEILFGLQLGHDRILFADRLATAGGPFPNRIAPNTAINFTLIGAALLGLDRDTGRGFRPAQALALPALLLSLAAIIGYGYGVGPLYAIPSYIPMALNTAIAFFMLAAGVLFARPDRGWTRILVMDDEGGAFARRLLALIVITLPLLGRLKLLGQQRGYYNTEFGVPSWFSRPSSF